MALTKGTNYSCSDLISKLSFKVSTPRRDSIYGPHDAAVKTFRAKISPKLMVVILRRVLVTVQGPQPLLKRFPVTELKATVRQIRRATIWATAPKNGKTIRKEWRTSHQKASLLLRCSADHSGFLCRCGFTVTQR